MSAVTSEPAPGCDAAWRSVLDPGRQASALRVARDVAARVTDPGRVAMALAASVEQTPSPRTPARKPYAVADGDAGLAVTCAYLDACLPGEGWDAVGHEFLAAAVAGADSAPVGLFGGLSGLAFATVSLSRDGARYRRLLAALDDALAPRAAAVGALLSGIAEPGPVSTFDLISGAAGLGAYLLTHDPHGLLPRILGGLVTLARQQEPPAWMTPSHLLGDRTMARLHPHGVLDCGLAHGIPGPLTVLSLALRAGVEVPGQAEAIRRISDWLVLHRVRDGGETGWPAIVALTNDGGAGPPASSRTAWCYGTPGVARALWLAAQALDDEDLGELALHAMDAVLRRPVRLRGIASPTFCHGVSGLLHVVLRFADDTGLFREAVAGLVDELLAAYQPNRPLAYASLEPEGHRVDRAGILDGAAGVALVLLAAATGVEPTWDRLFLLS
ncbi:lanthionine synthetase C family protein [Nonomuraea gerenzanensis]|uniref:Lanthionine biosynthesis cyclase LanC n=1 Tax=Nonomuraea gerenzanensis TaxID=93944 RepID=A0A1M4EBC9_9ACTN|nr:lanthionine synthetase C family protein [Nonomuraea gerenzanensis]UBU18227.1 lanthionine synthetase C family protein [Nonomuraea gerenzanensis]SBO96042.1 Lanthionine biosynthesis cyclase LanC [Nonomuraea gerenzanensis]